MWDKIIASVRLQSTVLFSAMINQAGNYLTHTLVVTISRIMVA